MRLESPSSAVLQELDTGTLVERGPLDELIDRATELLRKGGGGLLQLSSGIFSLSRPVRLPARSRLQGRGASSVLQPVADFIGEALVLLDTVDAAEVRDLVCECSPVDAVPHGVLLHESGMCTLERLWVRDFSVAGVLLRRNSFLNRITQVSSSGNGQAGIRLADGKRGRGGQWMPNLLLGCISIRDRRDGFELDFAICTNLVGCQAHQSGRHGFYLHDTACSACLTGCRSYQALGNGVLVENSHEINISSSIFCWNRGHGIECAGVTWGTISANEIIDSGGRLDPQCHGIFLHDRCRSLLVSGNAIFSWSGHLPMLDGVHETADCENNNINANSVNYFTGMGVRTAGAGSTESHNLAVAQLYPHPAGFAQPLTWGPDKLPLGHEFTTHEIESVLQRLRAPSPSG